MPTSTAAHRRILITGGAGFIGANLLRRLQGTQAKLVVIDNLSTGRESYLQGIEHQFFQRDIRQLDSIVACFSHVDAVVHLAAYGNVVDSVQDPIANFQVNAQGTLNVLEAARRCEVRKIVFASTGGALMGKTTPPVDEKSVPQPISPYGASKLAGEGYCSAYSESYGIEVACCRFANVYGKYGAHKKGVITRYITDIAAGRPITIYGDGSSVRDYIFVEDLCSGILLALNAEIDGFDIFHLATGRGTSIAELADILYSFFPGSERRIQYRPARTGEVDSNFAAYGKARNKLGFEPSVQLLDGLRQTIDWYKSDVLR